MIRGPEVTGFYYGGIIEAWGRQLPDLPCPFRFENGLLYRCYKPSWNTGIEWEVDESETVVEHWKSVLECLPEPERTESAQAVTFLGVIDGQHRCRAATKSEAETPWPVPLGGLLGLLNTGLERALRQNKFPATL
jgi:hypothetical protein